MFLGIFVKRSAFAVGAMIVWWMIEGILWLLSLWIYRGSKEVMSDASELIFWLPLEAMSNLIKEPGSRLGVIKTMANQMGGFTKSYAVEFTDILIVIFWTLLFIFGSYQLLKKRDL